MRKEYTTGRKHSSKKETELYPIWIHWEVSGVDAVGKIAEEIVSEDAGDAPEQVDVDILFPEYLVNIGACAA